MLDYREAFRQVSNAKQGFFSPRAAIAKEYLDNQFAKNPQAFKTQNAAEGKLQNKVKVRETAIGEFPKFKSGDKTPTIYPE